MDRYFVDFCIWSFWHSSVLEVMAYKAMGNIRGMRDYSFNTHLYWLSTKCQALSWMPVLKMSETQALARVLILIRGGWTCKKGTLTVCITGILIKKCSEQGDSPAPRGSGRQQSTKLLREGALLPPRPQFLGGDLHLLSLSLSFFNNSVGFFGMFTDLCNHYHSQF